MFCGHCGNQIEERSEFCGHCGSRTEEQQTEYPTEREYVQQIPTKRKKRKPLIIAIVSIAIMAVAAVGVFLFLNREQDEQPIEQILELAEEALYESDYERALTFFRVVIEREPFEPRGYTGAAEAYIGLDEPEQAEEILRQGLEVLPDSAQINAMLQDVELIIRQRPQDSPQAPPSDEPQPPPPDGGDISQPEPGSNELLSALQALYYELNASIERYGISFDWSEAGITFAKLVDFENDSIPELVFAINNLGYWDNTGFPDIGLYDYVISRYYDSTVTQFVIAAMDPYGETAERMEIIADSVDGTRYLMFHVWLNHDWGSQDDWFTIRDGQFVIVLTHSFQAEFEDNGNVIGHDMFLNDELIEGLEGNIAYHLGRSELGITDELVLPMMWIDPFGATVLPLLDEIRAMIEFLRV